MKEPQDELPQLVPNEDYYLEEGWMVMTAAYLTRRGVCCGSGCRWCPFEPKHEIGTTKLASDQVLLINDQAQS
jgi:hypothetical protein